MLPKKTLNLFIAVTIVSISALALYPPVVVHGSDYYRPDSLSKPAGTVISESETLYGNLVITGDLTIKSGVMLITDGYSIFCSGTFRNYGSIYTGNAFPQNYSNSFGGSGGGAILYGSNSIMFESGYSTQVSGGFGSNSSYPAQNGNTPAPPLLFPQNNTDLVQQWFRNGINNYLSGGAGQKAGGNTGGRGANGLYIQAQSIYNFGTMNASGEPGFGHDTYEGISGGGGGGVIIMAYATSIIQGSIYTNGGPGGISSNLLQKAGNGGSGTSEAFRSGSSLPISGSLLPEVTSPNYAFSGAYLNYTVKESVSGVNTSSYIRFDVSSVNALNQTFFLTVQYGRILGIPVHSYSQSFGSPNPLPYVTPRDLNFLFKGHIPSDLHINGVTTSISHENTSVPSGTGIYRSIELGNSNSNRGSFIWISRDDGLIVKETSVFPNDTFNMTLSSTNVFSHHGSGTTLTTVIIVASIAAVVVAVSLSLYYRGGVPGKGSEIETTDRMASVPSNVILARMEELKSLLDSGVITEQYYEESIAYLQSLKRGD